MSTRTENPTPFSEATDADLKSVRGICFDIDDTFSTEGKITAGAFQALWNLKNAGFSLVPVTGRPAGWCDHFARFWPIDGIVGENGAFVFLMQDGKRKRVDTLPPQDAISAIEKLIHLRSAIEAQFPGVSFASDQAYREYDLAIDFCEDVTPWKPEKIDALVKFCESQGAIAKISSIHVNTWFGAYTKLDGLRYFVKNTQKDDWIYIGDSPNDEPLFEKFKLSVGVANVRPFLPRMKSPPRWITQASCGEGFTELANRLLSLKR